MLPLMWQLALLPRIWQLALLFLMWQPALLFLTCQPALLPLICYLALLPLTCQPALLFLIWQLALLPLICQLALTRLRVGLKPTVRLGSKVKQRLQARAGMSLKSGETVRRGLMALGGTISAEVLTRLESHIWPWPITSTELALRREEG